MKHYSILKRSIGTLLILSMTASACACSDQSGGKKLLNAEEYETDEKFISIIDVPPSPLDDLSDYLGLGFSGYILTEDYVSFTKDGAITENYKTALRNLEAAGLDVYIRNQYNDPEYFQNEDDQTLRDKYSAGGAGGYRIPKRSLTDEFRQFGAVKGFYMADEPIYDNLDDYGELIDWYNTYYPGAYFHMNLLPSYASAYHLGNRSYPEYVQKYIDEIASKVKGNKSICLDNYPYELKGGVRPSFLSDLLITANKTKAYNDTAAPEDQAYMGLCIQTFKSGSLADITCTAQVSFQLCVGMAMGARMYEYFLYGSGMDMVGIFDVDRSKRVLYDYVQEANQKYLGFEKIINAFDWQGLYPFVASEERNVENPDAFSSVEELRIKDTGVLNPEKSSSRLDSVIGCFKRDGQDGYMVANYTNPSGGKVNSLTLSFNGCTRALIYTAEENGPVATEVKLVDGAVRLNLAAGEGIFIIPGN